MSDQVRPDCIWCGGHGVVRVMPGLRPGGSPDEPCPLCFAPEEQQEKSGPREMEIRRVVYVVRRRKWFGRGEYKRLIPGRLQQFVDGDWRDIPDRLEMLNAPGHDS